MEQNRAPQRRVTRKAPFSTISLHPHSCSKIIRPAAFSRFCQREEDRSPCERSVAVLISEEGTAAATAQCLERGELAQSE